MTEIARDENYWTNARALLHTGRTSYNMMGNPPFDIDFASAELGLDMRLQSEGIKLFRAQRHFEWKEKFAVEAEVTRKLLAKLLNVGSNDIYFSHNTTYAMYDLIAPLRRMSSGFIVTTMDEYGSIDQTLESFGSPEKVVRVETGDGLLERLNQTLNLYRPIVLVTSHVTHGKCEVLPVEEIADLARRKGILYFIDAAQSVGQIPVDVQEIKPDALVGCGHKWLRGETVTGFIYVSRDSGLDSVVKRVPGGYDLSPEVIRKRGYTPTFIDLMRDNGGNGDHIAHLGLALGEHEKLGWQNEYDRIEYLGKLIIGVLSQNPFVEIIPRARLAPGMIPFRMKKIDSKEIRDRLLGAYGIRVTHKPEEDMVRVAVSPFNLRDEIYALDNALKSIALLSE